MESFLVAALYKFVRLSDVEELRDGLLKVCQENDVSGTLILAREGVNGTISGRAEAVHEVLDFLKRDDRFSNLDIKFAEAAVAPFRRIKVRLKEEIVTMGVPGVDPTQTAGTYVEPKDWNELIKDPDVLLVDTRNDYEVALGTFEGAKNPALKCFRDFPNWLRAEMKGRSQSKVAMFCTGGIRCEKSTSFLRNEGVEQVFHLKGGILKYLEVVPEEESLWEGECFVFDQRVSVGHRLEEGSYALCRACRNPIDEIAMESPEFENGISCPQCFNKTTREQKENFAERQKQIELAKSRGDKHLKFEDFSGEK